MPLPPENPFAPPEAGLSAGTHDPISRWEEAPLWRRFLAWLVDAVILTATSVLVMLAYALLAFSGEELEAMSGIGFEPSTAETLGIVFLPAVLHLVLNSWGWNRAGKSWGKRFLGLRIVTKDWEACSLARIYLRTVPFLLVPWVSVVGPIVTLIDWVMIFRTEPHCLHDDIAGTTVIWEGSAENI